jgi:uncharacterized protein (DUF2062 family)
VKAAAARFVVSIQGLSGESIAAMLALGLVLGTFPVYGCPTLMCVVAALVFRMNLPALQLVNQLTSPLQIALVYPFVKIGERVLGTHGGAGGNIPANLAASNLACRFGEFTAQAIAGWICLAIPAGLLLYIVLCLALKGRRPGPFQEMESPA